MPQYTVDIVEDAHYRLTVVADSQEEAEIKGLFVFVANPERNEEFFCDVREREVTATEQTP